MPKYTSRYKGANGKWIYQYPDDDPQRSAYHLSIPADPSQHIDAKVAQERQSYDEYRQQAIENNKRFGLPDPPEYDEAEARSRLLQQHHDWAGKTQAAYGRIRSARGVLQEHFPEAKIDVAGSFAQGKFYAKGPRDYDLDLHASGLPLPPSNGKDTVPLPPHVHKAIKAASDAAGGDTLDTFVTHEGKLWVVDGNKLSRKPGMFGKGQVTNVRGVTQRVGKQMDWDEFQGHFYDHLNSYDKHSFGKSRGSSAPEGLFKAHTSPHVAPQGKLSRDPYEGHRQVLDAFEQAFGLARRETENTGQLRDAISKAQASLADRLTKIAARLDLPDAPAMLHEAHEHLLSERAKLQAADAILAAPLPRTRPQVSTDPRQRPQPDSDPGDRSPAPSRRARR